LRGDKISHLGTHTRKTEVDKGDSNSHQKGGLVLKRRIGRDGRVSNSEGKKGVVFVLGKRKDEKTKGPSNKREGGQRAQRHEWGNWRLPNMKFEKLGKKVDIKKDNAAEVPGERRKEKKKKKWQAGKAKTKNTKFPGNRNEPQKTKGTGKSRKKSQLEKLTRPRETESAK